LKTRLGTIYGFVLAGVAMAFVGAAGTVVTRALTGPSRTAEVRERRERVFVVPIGTLQSETISPVITSYGRVVSGRSFDVRSSVGGQLVLLADGFRNGGVVGADQEMFRIDPARLETAVALAQSDLAEAEADLSRTDAALALAEMDAEAAQTQLDLRTEALARQQMLAEREIARAADLEAAAFARAAALQTSIGRQQAVAAERARITQAGIAVQRRRIALQEAERALRESVVIAPFDGVMTASTAILGQLVSANEKLGVLIDPRELEVSFRLTNTQFTRLLDGQGQLRAAEVTLLLQTWRSTQELRAVLDRADAEVGERQVGRLVYARLIDPDPATVRPGDFVTIRVNERPQADVVRIPAAAAAADGRILLIGEGNRLEEVQARVLRNQGDTLIVTDVPIGRDYVLARSMQLGAGLRVEPVSAVASIETAAPANDPVLAADMILLDDDRRAALIAFIQGNEQMRAETRTRSWTSSLNQKFRVPPSSASKRVWRSNSACRTNWITHQAAAGPWPILHATPQPQRSSWP